KGSIPASGFPAQLFHFLVRITLWAFSSHRKGDVEVHGKIVLHKGNSRIDRQYGPGPSEAIVPPDQVLDGHPFISGPQRGRYNIPQSVACPGPQGKLVGNRRDGLVGKKRAQGFPESPYAIDFPRVDQIESTAVGKYPIGQLLIELKVKGDPESPITGL